VLHGRYLVKIRYSYQADPAWIEYGPGDLFTLRFQEPQHAVTPGQFAVFYDDEEVVGSAEICADS